MLRAWSSPPLRKIDVKSRSTLTIWQEIHAANLDRRSTEVCRRTAPPVGHDRFGGAVRRRWGYRTGGPDRRRWGYRTGGAVRRRWGYRSGGAVWRRWIETPLSVTAQLSAVIVNRNEVSTSRRVTTGCHRRRTPTRSERLVTHPQIRFQTRDSLSRSIQRTRLADFRCGHRGRPQVRRTGRAGRRVHRVKNRGDGFRIGLVTFLTERFFGGRERK